MTTPPTVDVDPPPAPQGRPPRGAGGRLGRWLLLALLLGGMAALVVLVRRAPSDAFTARRDDGPGVLEASCGGPGAPCRVGVPLYLRLRPVTGGVAYVLVGEGAARSAVAGPLDVSAGVVTAVPLTLVPEPADVAAGFVVQAVIVAQALEPADVTRVAPTSTLRLSVVP